MSSHAEPSSPRQPRRKDPNEDVLRPHVYDGIQEYDKRLPNWWLWTFYGAIFFSVGYWFLMHQAGSDFSPEARLAVRMTEMKARAASLSTGPLSDDQLWALSQDSNTVAAGREAFTTTCVSCHGQDLKGGIGANLADSEWIHGGTPSAVVKTISEGVLAKGMPAWGPVLGEKRVRDVAAYVMSHHSPDEKITIVAAPASSATAPTTATTPAPPAVPAAPVAPTP